ncbi:MAG: zf-HC2 domain-containing protein [Actinomycetota bacterium]|jgi:anti-sigma factor RsiW|nr:zf-HC2 domain-containing protein [Actinomycetota bacterium]
MENEAIEELLQAYAVGDVSEVEAERVEAALDDSPRLREELARYERLFVLLVAAAEEEVKVPRDLRARIVWRVAVTAYLNSAAELARGLLGAYGRALIYYLRLA